VDVECYFAGIDPDKSPVVNNIIGNKFP